MSTPIKSFHVVSKSSWGIASPIDAEAVDKNYPPLVLSIPPEFSGPGEGYSPEDLYALSLLNCYLATFKFVAEKSKLTFSEITGKATLEVGDTEGQKNWMKSLTMSITLKGCDQHERAMGLLQKTTSHCMIHQSVKTQIHFDFAVE